MADRLVVVQTEPIGVDGGLLSFSAKTFSGLEQYVRHWPGEVVVVARGAGLTADPLARVESRAGLPFGVELVDEPTSARALQGAAAVLAMHQPSNAALLSGDARRVVWFGEFPLVERIRSAALVTTGGHRVRATAGWLAKSRLLRNMVRSSGGFQSNGYPAAEQYARFAPTSMVYFDTRISSSMTDETATFLAREHVRQPPIGTLRLGFSGRHIKAKGPEYAVGAVMSLVADGVDVSLDIFGAGAMTHQLRELARPAGERIRFRGSLPFEKKWVPAVRVGIDVMVLPHVQGDPSGTYLEAVAAGAPVLGFDNRALDPLVRRHEIGWTVPMRDQDALRDRIVSLRSSRGEIEAATDAGLRFMREHPYDKEFRRRVQHLRAVAGV